MTISLDQQVRVGLISCSPNCVFTPSAITTYAVAIVLDHAALFGQAVSGETLLAIADAE